MIYLKKLMGLHGGLCERARVAADELIAAARDLKERISHYEKQPDPFEAALSALLENRASISAEDKKLAMGAEPRNDRNNLQAR